MGGDVGAAGDFGAVLSRTDTRGGASLRWWGWGPAEALLDAGGVEESFRRSSCSGRGRGGYAQLVGELHGRDGGALRKGTDAGFDGAGSGLLTSGGDDGLVDLAAMDFTLSEPM